MDLNHTFLGKGAGGRGHSLWRFVNVQNYDYFWGIDLFPRDTRKIYNIKLSVPSWDCNVD